MSKCIAGVDIGGTSVKFGVFEENGNLIYSTKVPSVIGDPEAMTELIAQLVEQSTHRVSMLGVGTPGAVLMPENLVTAGNLKWRKTPLRAMLTERLKMPVWVDNDAQTQLAAEWWSGACKGLSSVVYLAFGTGVGGALLINGRPWRGHQNTAGELGHIIIHADGEPCSCGMRGCYEAYASATALARMGGGRSAREIVDLARGGDEEMAKVFERYLHEVALGIASYYMVFRPEAIVLGGGISAAGEIFLDGIRRELMRIQPGYGDEIGRRLCLAMYRNEAGMRGAAALAAINLQ